MNKILLFFHGFLGTHADWHEVARFLPEFICLGIDLPGHGSTPFTESFFDELPSFKKPIHLIGYSMGGRLAMQFANRFPFKIASLTIASAHFGYKTQKEKEERLEIDRYWAKQFLEKPIDETLHEWYDQPLFKSLRIDYEVRRKQDVQAIAKSLMYYSAGKQPFLQPKKAFYLVGERDVKYRLLYNNLPHEVIPKAGHAVHLENPKAVADAIRRNIC